MRLAYWACRRQLGKVISPMTVVYARKPALLRLALKMTGLRDNGLSLSPELVTLITAQTALLNGCAFCQDLHLAEAMKKKLGLDKFRKLDSFHDSDIFSAAERAALSFTKEATIQKHVKAETMSELKRHFNEVQIVEITWVNATGNYFNLMAAPLELPSDDLIFVTKS